MVQKSDRDARRMTGRTLVFAIEATVAEIALKLQYGIGLVEKKSSKGSEDLQFSDDGAAREFLQLWLSSSKPMWKQQRSPGSHVVPRHAATKRPFSGQDCSMHAKGLYRSIFFSTAGFSSEAKFESGTGWPSFWLTIAKENVHESTGFSLKMIRALVSCRLHGAHLSQLFDDGSKPTGLRQRMS
jgi:methionine-R-sulfoxide reductase